MKFKPGEKIAFYDEGRRGVGRVVAYLSETSKTLGVKNSHGVFNVHEKQCRRIIKKEEIYLNQYASNGSEFPYFYSFYQLVYHTREEADRAQCADRVRCVKFRQVMEK